MLTALVRADHSTWTFTYDNFVNVNTITLPTGGTITYGWGTRDFTGTGSTSSRVVTSRTLTDNNGHSYRWQYNWGSLSNLSFTNVVTDPAGNDTAHVFTNLGGGNEGYFETSTLSYQGPQSGAQLLRRVDTAYGTAVVIGVHLGNVFPTSIQTTIYPSNKVSLVTKTYDAGLGAGAPIFGNVVTEKQYDWGQGAPGALLRETDTTYQWQINGAYLTAQLPDLPATVIVKDGSGCALSETDYAYDESAYLTPYESTVGALPTGTHIAAPAAVRGNQTSVIKWLVPTSSCNPKSGSSVVSHTNWYDTGEVYQQIDPLGHTTTHSYDPVYAGAYATKTCSPSTSGISHCVSGTYSFATGLLTSLTNENATTPASGNTPGDSGHTSNYSYDSMLRLTSATAPPDPANGGLSAQTNFNFSAPNAFPFNVLRTKSITASLTDSATSFFDGMGRGYKSQHVLPGGTATVDTTLDFANHPAVVSNPYFSTSDPTYGTTGTLFDALGRAYSVTKQDGSISSVAYNVITGAHDAVIGANTMGDCTDTKDEAGKQRRACTDALGRLVQVSEPNPVASASNASGSVTVNGNEQASTQSGFPATGQVTITTLTDGEQVTIVCRTTCVSSWDTGNVNISVNGYPKTATYGEGSTTSTVAAALRDAFHNDASSPVDASCADQPCTNPVITFTARTVGVATDYALACSTTNAHFSPPSFTPSCPAALGGGVDPITTPDSGSVTITVNGTNYSTTYGGGDTTATIAQRLASVISAGTLANASASGNTVSITTKTGGTSTNYSLAASYAWNNSSFTNPSFTTSTSGSVLLGGYDAGALDNQPYVTLYQYDALGNLLRVDQKGTAPNDSTQWRTRTFTYDSLSRLLTANNPESGTITYSYDLDGNLLQKTSPAPNQTGTATQTVSYCYDELHRVFGKGYGAQSCPLATPVVTYVYDSGTNAKGKLTSLTDQAGTASYSYDILGRLSAETRTLTGANNVSIPKNLSYEYNLDGSLYKLHYPSGNVVTYAPGTAGLTLSAIDSGNAINYVTGATYGPDSALTGFVSGNSGTFAGITNAFNFNKRLQPVNMSANAPSQTVFSIGYDFHSGTGTAGTGTDNGNVFGITNYKDSTRTQTFTYDLLNRLASARNAGTDCSVTVLGGLKKFWGNTYTYDAWGNLIGKALLQTPAPPACAGENLSLTADARNWIHATGGSDYQYDAAGNMTFNATPPTQTYTYDQENRLTGAAGFAYTYDGDGNRVRKSNGTTGTLYWYMTPGIVGESDLSGNLTDEYVFFDGERVARKSTNGVFYYFSDHLKTASVITDSLGNIKSESDFYPWGGELQFVNNDSNHYKFTGKERDGETQLDYFGARYYSNGLGRFVTPDWAAKATAVPYAEFADPQSLNLYSYVRNVPTIRFDQDGHCDDGNFFCDIGRGFMGGLYQATELTRKASELFHPISRPGGDAQAAETGQGNVPEPVFTPANKTQEVTAAVTRVAAPGALGLVGMEAEAVEIVDMTATSRTPSVLATRAEEIHGVLDPIAQSMRTTAVADVTNADGTISTLVSSSRNTLAPAQRAVLQPGETAVAGAGHAEETILNAAQQNGQTVNTMGVSRTPCPTCQQKLDQAGVQVQGPN